MKMMKLLLTVSVPVFGLLTSCQKETDFTFGNNRTQNDSTWLSKIIGLDTTLAPGSDTTQRLFLTYDNAKRLVRLDTYGNAVPLVTDTVIHTYYYQGSDSLPYKIIIDEHYNFGTSTNYQTIIYNFYNNGFVAKDSVIELNVTSGTNNGATVSVYSIAGSTVNRFRALYDFIGGTYVLSSRDTSVYTVAFSGGNLVSQSLVSGSGSYQSAQISYDTKINPLAKVFKIRYPVFESPYYEVWGIQPSNVVQAQYQEPFNPTYTDLYTYKYRTDGYPASSTYNTNQGGTVYNKALYYYTAL